MTGQRQLPGIGLYGYWNYASDAWGTLMDSNLRKASVLVQLSVIGRVSSLPGSPTNGDIYILTTDDTVCARDDGSWVAYTPIEGWLAYVRNENKLYYYDGSDWVDYLAALTADIDAEQARAEGAEAALQANIDAETTRAETAETDIKTETLFPPLPNNYQWVTPTARWGDNNNRQLGLQSAEALFVAGLDGQLSLVSNYVTGANPFAMETDLHTLECRQWVASKAYAVGQFCWNTATPAPSRYYICVTAGASASSGGPSGTGTGITDGTCTWDYAGEAASEDTFNISYIEAQLGNDKEMRAYIGNAADDASWADLFPLATGDASVIFSEAPAGDWTVTSQNRVRFWKNMDVMLGCPYQGQSWTYAPNDANPVTSAIATTPIYPALSYALSGAVTSGAVLSFASLTGVEVGMSVTGHANIPVAAVVIAMTSTTVTMNFNVLGTVPDTTSIKFGYGRVGMSPFGVRTGNYPQNLTDQPRRWEAAVPAVEVSASATGQPGETPLSGYMNHLLTNILFYFPGTSATLMGAVDAHGGSRLTELTRGSATMEGQLVAWLTDFRRFALSQGRKPIIPAFPWTHGQADSAVGTSRAQYIAEFITIRDMLWELVRTMLPWQDVPPTIIIDILAASSQSYGVVNEVSQAQYELGEIPGFAVSHPGYIIPCIDGNGHPTQIGYNREGQYASWPALFSRPIGSGWTDLRLDKTRGRMGVEWTSATEFVTYWKRFQDRGKLVFDLSGTDVLIGGSCTGTGTSTAITGNAGFDYIDSTASGGGAASVTIASAAIVADDVVKFTLSGTPTGVSPKLFAGCRSDVGKANYDALNGGGRTCLRLDDGDTRLHRSLYNDPGTGTPHINYTWASPFGGIPLYR